MIHTWAKYLVIIILLTTGACVLLDGAVGVPVPPPNPSAVPIETLAPTPTREVIVNEPLNDNFSFEFDEKFGHVEKIDNRTVFVPFSWLVRWIPNPAILDPNPHPDVFYREGGVRMEVSNRGGAFGVASHINACAGCRYIVVAEYTADLGVMQGATLNGNDLYGYCRLDNLAGDNVVTHPIRVKMQGEQEFLCVFEVEEARTVRFDALINSTWAVLEGHVDFTEVRAEQVSPDDYEDAVIPVP